MSEAEEPVVPEFKWKSWRPSGLDPELAGRELVSIRDEYGSVEADVVVAAVRKRGTGSPLYGAIFHVSAARAAGLYFEERARKVVQAVYSVETDERAFVFVPRISVVEEGEEPAPGQYMRFEDVELDPGRYQAVLDEKRRRLAQFAVELRPYPEFADIVAAINKHLARGRG